MFAESKKGEKPKQSLEAIKLFRFLSVEKTFDKKTTLLQSIVNFQRKSSCRRQLKIALFFDVVLDVQPDIQTLIKLELFPTASCTTERKFEESFLRQNY
jgi:hypothetical protein